MASTGSQVGSNELLTVALAVIESLEAECESPACGPMLSMKAEWGFTVCDDSFAKLGAVFPQKMVIAALDHLDRGNSTWGTIAGHSTSSRITLLRSH